MTEAIKIPTYALPLVVSLFVGAMSYGAAKANAQQTVEDVRRIEAIVTKTAQMAAKNGTSTMLNEQAIEHIVDTLGKMEETAKASDDKLGQLITIMLEQKT